MKLLSLFGIVFLLSIVITSAETIIEPNSGLEIITGNVTYQIGGTLYLDNISKNVSWLYLEGINHTITANDTTNITISTYSPTSNLFLMSLNNSYNTSLTYNITGKGTNASIIETGTNTIYQTAFTTTTLASFSYYFLQNVYITFKDQDDESVVTEPMTINFIGDIASYEYSTSTGIIDVDVVRDDYVIRYSSDNYSERTVYLTVDQDLNLTLYMINNTDTSNITVTVYDQDGTGVQGAIVKALKYNSTLNQYVLQESDETNSQGKVYFSLTLYEEYYKFIVVYNNETVLTTSPDYIRETSIDLTITLGEQVGIRYDLWNDLEHELTYNDLTNNFRLTWNYLGSSMDQICLELWRKNGISSVFNSSSCSSSEAGTILIGVTPLNGSSFEARAYYYEDTSRYFVTSLVKSWNNIVEMGDLGILLQIILTGAVAMVAFWSLSVMTILVPLSLVLGRAIGLTTFGYEILIPLVIVGVFLSFMLRRKGGIF